MEATRARVLRRQRATAIHYLRRVSGHESAILQGQIEPLKVNKKVFC